MMLSLMEQVTREPLRNLGIPDGFKLSDIFGLVSNIKINPAVAVIASFVIIFLIAVGVEKSGRKDTKDK